MVGHWDRYPMQSKELGEGKSRRAGREWLEAETSTEQSGQHLDHGGAAYI